MDWISFRLYDILFILCKYKYNVHTHILTHNIQLIFYTLHDIYISCVYVWTTRHVTRKRSSRILTLVQICNTREIHGTMRFSNLYGYWISTTYVTYYEVVLLWTWNTNRRMSISSHATLTLKNNELCYI